MLIFLFECPLKMKKKSKIRVLCQAHLIKAFNVIQKYVYFMHFGQGYLSFFIKIITSFLLKAWSKNPYIKGLTIVFAK